MRLYPLFFPDSIKAAMCEHSEFAKIYCPECGSNFLDCCRPTTEVWSARHFCLCSDTVCEIRQNRNAAELYKGDTEILWIPVNNIVLQLLPLNWKAIILKATYTFSERDRVYMQNKLAKESDSLNKVADMFPRPEGLMREVIEAQRTEVHKLDSILKVYS